MSEHTPHNVPTLFYILSFIAMGYMFYNLRRLFTVKVGKTDERPLDFFGQLYNSLSFGVGQRKVYSKRFTYASVMHFLIGWGFIELFFAILTISINVSIPFLWPDAEGWLFFFAHLLFPSITMATV